jgi:hypothetical protein
LRGLAALYVLVYHLALVPIPALAVPDWMAGFVLFGGSGVTLNRDASLLFDDEEVAQYYAEAFELDWERAREPTVKQTTHESVILAEGAAPPQGYVRMSLSDYLEG